MNYPSDVTDSQWKIIEPLLNPKGKSGPKFSNLRSTFNALCYQLRTGCMWRYIPKEYGDNEAIWSQFRRWRDNGVWAEVLAALHPKARCRKGRKTPFASMVVIDPSLVRGASNGGPTFHTQGGPFGATNGAKLVIAVDTTGLPLAGLSVPSNTADGQCAQLLLEHMQELGLSDNLQCVKVDRGIKPATAERLSVKFGLQVQIYGGDGPAGVFKPIPQAWKVEVAHGALGRYRRLAKSFEKTTASSTAWLQLAAIGMVLKALS